MRALPICLLSFMLSGCSMLSRSPVNPLQSTPATSATSPSGTEKNPLSPRLPVRIFISTEALADTPFRELGEVSGDACQASNQDSPPTIPAARKRMQLNAARMKANAVLQYRCDIITSTPGCYRQALCIGSALYISAQ